MAKTPIYNLGYLVPNQDLSENLDLDELRFKAIDSQVYSLYQIFKNGISTNTIDNISWEINTYSDSNKLTKVSVSTGAGNVSWKAAETTSSKDVILPVLPSGVTEARIWLYAIENTNTPVTKDVDFIASLTEINESFQLKIKSEQLFSYAKRAVEIAIEEDEEKALNYLVEAGK